MSAFFQDMRARGLDGLVLVVNDGAPDIIKAIETCFPPSERQRRLAHRMRNLAAKAPGGSWRSGERWRGFATAPEPAPLRAHACLHVPCYGTGAPFIHCYPPQLRSILGRIAFASWSIPL